MPAEPAPRYDGSIAAAISTAVVGLWRDFTGRGPTRAVATFGADVIVVTLRESLTRGERALGQRGLATEVLAMRRAMHHAMRDELIDAVEALTGAAVEAVFADSLLNPDIAVVVFLMHPGAGVPPRPAKRVRRSGA